MKNYFIFQYEDRISFSTKQVVTVIFIHQSKIESQNVLAEEINEFFQERSLSDKLIVILPSYLEAKSLDYFQKSRDITFQRLPGKSEKYFQECLSVYKYTDKGNLEIFIGKDQKNKKAFEETLFRSGMTQIFQKNGGLVESSPDHHFVFPSGKHCSKFIRTGNVLVKNSEIFFLALKLLKYVDNKRIIYCDTSSINVLPFSCFELKRRFGNKFDCPTVHSFESYELFESSRERFNPDSLVLISSSTSGNIIDRILREKLAFKEQIKVVYFLGSTEKFIQHEQNILCNLTRETDFPNGEVEFDTYSSDQVCDLCENHSHPVNIRSDVFLTIQPKISKLLIAAKDDYVPKSLSSFVQKYRGINRENVLLKVFYKDNEPDLNYEIFIDTEKLFSKIEEDQFLHFKDGLIKLIDKHIPANTKYLLYLPDKGSEDLAKIIQSKIPAKTKVELLKLEPGFEDKINSKSGSVVVVASCISTGKKLLHISRLMRKHEQMSLIYFVGILRTSNEEYSKTLISNLSKGKNSHDERPFIAVEKINCTIEQKNTSWFKEEKFLAELIGNINETQEGYLYKFIEKRLAILRSNKEDVGFSSNVFMQKSNGDSLVLQKNFAFWGFAYKEKEAFQSEVYFTISSIITFLENKKINSHPSLQQSNYIRNILSPANFQRFNDGVIQASILRAAKAEYFAYDYDTDASIEMKTLLFSMIEQYNTAHGEAILEFLLAIGLKKLRLKKADLVEVIEKAISCENPIISGFATQVKSQVLSGNYNKGVKAPKKAKKTIK